MPFLLFFPPCSPAHRHRLPNPTSSSPSRPPLLPPHHLSSFHLPLSSTPRCPHLQSQLQFPTHSHHDPPNTTSNGNDNNNGNGGDGGGDGDRWRWGGSWRHPHPLLIFPFTDSRARDALPAVAALIGCLSLSTGVSLARTAEEHEGDNHVWEVKGGRWSKLAPDPSGDGFLVDGRMPRDGIVLQFSIPSGGVEFWWRRCCDVWTRLMLPEGYPDSVTGDYLEYSLWRGVQGIASQINGVLSTQALLYAVGLGKGAIPTAAAINWVLKDGLGYLSKILLSNFGRHFDVHPKGWRLFSDLLENASYGLEILTPSLPHLFVPIGAVAGASRSASALIQAATRSCFFAGFAAQRNFAEVIAKGEAQGMVSKVIGIMLGIALSNYVRSSSSLALASFSIVTGVQLYCNLKSYQSIQLRTLNPYRACLVFSEYLLSGQVPLVKEVNDEEPFFPDFPISNVKSSYIDGFQTLSLEAKDAAVQIGRRLQLGSGLSEVISGNEDAWALFGLYKDEEYMLMMKDGKYHVILKEGASPEDMLRSVFQANYLYWLETNVGWLQPRNISDECQVGGKLQLSLDYARREFLHVKHDGQQSGWVMDGLIARPLPCRICPGYNVAANYM